MPGPEHRRTVVITGSASGIGARSSYRFAAGGDCVVVADRNEAGAEKVAQGIRDDGYEATAIPVDVRDPESVQAMVDRVVDTYSSIDVVINNAMLCGPTTFLDAPVEEMRADLDVNVLGALLVTQRALPHMIAAGRGVIVNVSSVNAYADFGNVSYSATKAALVNLTKTIAAQFGNQGIRCVGVAPGTVRTEVWDHRVANSPGLLDRVAQHYPLGRVGTPDDIAEALLFLTSDAASWITGVTLPVEGGILAGNLAMSRELTDADQG